MSAKPERETQSLIRFKRRHYIFMSLADKILLEYTAYAFGPSEDSLHIRLQFIWTITIKYRTVIRVQDIKNSSTTSREFSEDNTEGI